MADSTMMPAAENSLVATPYELCSPPCCQLSSQESSGPAMVPETQRPVSPVISQLDGAVRALDAAPDLPDLQRPLPILAMTRSPQSVLCTFLI
jgi:hypothetical protein